MNRAERRALQREQRQHIKAFPAQLREMLPEEFQHISPRPQRCWISRKYLVQLYDEGKQGLPYLVRLSVCRSKLGIDGHWEDGLTWDELQQIKREVGYGDWYGMEVYPSDANVVNVANMRHLWLLPEPLPIGWVK